MKRDRCKTARCRRQSMPGSDRCFYCRREELRTPPQVAARQIAAVTGDHSDIEDDAA